MKSRLRWIPALVVVLGFAGCGESTPPKMYGCPNLPSWEDWRCPCEQPANDSSCSSRSLMCFYGTNQEMRCTCGQTSTWKCSVVTDGGAGDGGGTGDGGTGTDDGGMTMSDGSVSDAPLGGG